MTFTRTLSRRLWINALYLSPIVFWMIGWQVGALLLPPTTDLTPAALMV